VAGYCEENKYTAEAQEKLGASASQLCQRCQGVMKKFDIACDIIGICGRERGGQKGNTWCTMCDLIFTLLKSDVNDGHIARNVLNTAKKVCNMLPVKTQECVDRVEFVEGMSQMLISDMFTPSYICSRAGICEREQKMKNTLDNKDDDDKVQHFSIN